MDKSFFTFYIFINSNSITCFFFLNLFLFYKNLPNVSFKKQNQSYIYKAFLNYNHVSSDCAFSCLFKKTGKTCYRTNNTKYDRQFDTNHLLKSK